MSDTAQSKLSHFIWQTRYRDSGAQPAESGLDDTWKRVATAVAAVERDPQLWAHRFLGILRDFRFLPGGRILAGAGTTRRVTLFNCFVMGLIDDSVEGIFDGLKEGALTMQQGGGVGYDFSTLRPRGSIARTTGMLASGPVSFMRIWDAMCATLLSTGARRGAMMATLRCDHPDIEEFIDAKRDPDALHHFNLSVQVTDAFMQAVKADADWPLVFPQRDLRTTPAEDSSVVTRAWTGSPAPVPCTVRRVVRARELWRRLCDSAHDCAEPGVLFIDRINASNNLGYCEQITTTNPCAEEPLPPYGACNLGSINLTAFVVDPFGTAARLDHDAMRACVQLAVRFLDNVIEISRFPLFRQREQVHRSRRIGLGITGLADALAMLGLRYDGEAAREAAAAAMRTIRDAAYEASVQLARERGAFPAFDADAYLDRPFIRALPDGVRGAIRAAGIRNSHLTAIAPAGTISLLAHNVSSGIEPIFGIEMLRRVLDSQGKYCNFQLTDYAYAVWRSLQPLQRDLPASFVTSDAIAPREHLLMQAALQPYVDGAISKTITLAQSSSRSEMAQTLAAAHELGLKGCTVFRIGARSGVLGRSYNAGRVWESEHGSHCCDVARECD